MFLFERVDAMEYEVVSVKVPKGLVKEGTQLVIGFPRRQTHLFIGNVYCPGVGGYSVFLTPKLLKPDWNPPKLKKGWVTWDESCGWYWWESRPEYHAVNSWTYPQSGDVFDNEEIGSMMAEILGCPCCDGFDERNCIWEVGE